MTSSELTGLSLTEVASAIAAREVSSLEVTRALSIPFIPSCLPTTAWLSGTDIILSQWIL